MELKSLYKVHFTSISPNKSTVVVLVISDGDENIESLAWKKFIEKHGEYSVCDYEISDVTYISGGFKGGCIL